MYFVAITLDLQLLDGPPVAGIQGSIHAHAAVLQAVSSQNRELGRALHAARRTKNFSIALIENNARSAMLRLCFLSEHGLDATNAVMNGIAQDPVFRLGNSRLQVGDVRLSGTPWTGLKTWGDLLATPHGLHCEFTFATPTAFTKDNGRGRKYISVLPHPNDLFLGLARRWRDLTGPELPPSLPDYLMQGGCVISSHRLHTEVVKLNERTQVGFLRRVTYKCLDTDAEHVAAINQLTRFAMFSGVGYQTARVMGTVMTRVLD